MTLTDTHSTAANAIFTSDESLKAFIDLAHLSVNPGVESELMRKHDYAAVAQRFADKIRREELSRAA